MYQKIKKWYEDGMWVKEMVKNAVIKTQYTYIIKQPDKTDGFEVEQ